VAYRTPVVTSRTLDERVGASVFLKAETFQRTGSFKFRGAYNAVASLTAEERAKGVVAASSGNHAQALALAGSMLSTRVTVLMPEDAPRTKVEATRGYGAEVIFYDRYRDDREAVQQALVDERQANLIPPFEHPAIVSGAGTIALELLEDIPDIDAIVAPVSGGGLIAGCGLAAKERRPSVEMWGVEPAEACDTLKSLEAGHRVRLPVAKTIADGLTVATPGEMTFGINQSRVSGVLLVSDSEIVDAMRFLFERLKLVVEPSGAASLAGILTSRGRFSGRRVGVILTGGNVDLDRFCELLSP
jgi:threonine dehydratase